MVIENEEMVMMALVKLKKVLESLVMDEMELKMVSLVMVY
jgi:hypothetical protein